ncbi:tol-pal system protein YbgF [Rhodomicrobium vannielii ATCC 17100]|uniref:tol-pal system protein YbgF n=1 Tax=Rhodomicrobium vannielii TaxID=1069 RepID=UPI00191840D4|nr:tol-pal system protein YbgF [Rhodomicrobium vannielii]MBJ7533144.1 tol-pal system protein YbgF [Rhodomicrobium vannielii ATCC 17100]
MRRIIAASVLSLVLAAPLAGAEAQTRDNTAQRVDRLEEQINNLQSVVTAVESLAKSGGGAGYGATAGGGASSADLSRLSAQIADLTQRIQRLEARLASASPGADPTQPRTEAAYNNTFTPAAGFEAKEPLKPLGEPVATPDRYGAAQPSQPADAFPRRQTASAGQAASPVAPRIGTDATPAALPASGGARALFEQGTGALNRREYSAAETYFQQVVDQYPNDPVAGPAYYWLGETAFVSGEYRTAADRFLKTFTAYPNTERAPEALLKLAISLRRLGEKAAACDSFAELQRRYPQGPKAVLQRAEVEKKRAECS